jgi:hypothetical protein
MWVLDLAKTTTDERKSGASACGFVERRDDLTEIGERAHAHASRQFRSGGDLLAESVFTCVEKPVLPQHSCAIDPSVPASSRVEDDNPGEPALGTLAGLLLVSVLLSRALLLVLLLFNAKKDNEDTSPISTTETMPSASALTRCTRLTCMVTSFGTIYSLVFRYCNPESNPGALRSAGYRGGKLPRGYTMRQLTSRRKYGRTVFAIACCVLSSVTATAVLSSVTGAPAYGWVVVPGSKSCYVDAHNCVVVGGAENCTFAYRGSATVTQPKWEVGRESPTLSCDREYLQVGQRKYCTSASDRTSEPFPVSMRVSGTTDFTFLAYSKQDRLSRLRLCVHDATATERRMSASDSFQCMVGLSHTLCKK